MDRSTVLAALGGVAVAAASLYALRRVYHALCYWEYDGKFHLVLDHKAPSPRFDVHDAASLSAALAYLDTHGYVVVGNVVAPAQLASLKALFWEHIEATSPGVRRDNIDSWTNISVGATGILPFNGIGQSRFLWSVRTLPTVRRVFEAIWGGDAQLLVSFDGANIYRPWQHKPEWRTISGWYHVDQNALYKKERVCVQALVSLYNADERSGSLVVVPGSQRHYLRLADVSPKSGRDFVKIPPGHPVWNRSFGLPSYAKVVHCKAGDMLLWDSRTIHCNTHAAYTPRTSYNDKGEPIPDLVRLVAYVCMTPAAFTSSEDRGTLAAVRRKAYESGITTNHWPHEFRPNDEGADAGRHPNIDDDQGNQDPLHAEIKRLLFADLLST